MEFKCINCGHTQFYLKEVGPNTGVYCSRCHKWHNWVAKKDIGTIEPQADFFLRPSQLVNLGSQIPTKETNAVGSNAAQGPHIEAQMTLEEVLIEMKRTSEEITNLNEKLKTAVSALVHYSILAEEKAREQNTSDDDGELPWNDIQ